MKILQKQTELQEFLKKNSQDIAFIPTMGNLHEGHISLIQTAKKYSKNVVFSIFVNPTQFSANEDFLTYPKTLEDDLTKLKNSNILAVYIPTIEDIYPIKPTINFDIPHLTQCLCGISRPHFFNGVITVVLKLLLQINPKFLILGEKDFQQYLVIKEMISSIGLPIQTITSPIIRNKNGLALSSRNGYFSTLEIPEKINKILFEFREKIKKNNIETSLLETKKQFTFLDELEYLEIRSSKDLTLYTNGEQISNFRLFFAGKINNIRLIDNISLENA